MALATAFKRVNLALLEQVVGGIEMYTAVFLRDGGSQVCIGAPTMKDLESEFYRITGRSLKIELARHVICVAAPEEK